MTIDDEYTNASFRLIFTDFNNDTFIAQLVDLAELLLNKAFDQMACWQNL